MIAVYDTVYNARYDTKVYATVYNAKYSVSFSAYTLRMYCLLYDIQQAVYDTTYCATDNTTSTTTMSINRKESFNIEICLSYIYCSFYIHTLTSIFCLQNLLSIYLFSSSFKRCKRNVCRLFPIRKKNTTK